MALLLKRHLGFSKLFQLIAIAIALAQGGLVMLCFFMFYFFIYYPPVTFPSCAWGYWEQPCFLGLICLAIEWRGVERSDG
jgi:hypothetical protein